MKRALAVAALLLAVLAPVAYAVPHPLCDNQTYLPLTDCVRVEPVAPSEYHQLPEFLEVFTGGGWGKINLVYIAQGPCVIVFAYSTPGERPQCDTIPPETLAAKVSSFDLEKLLPELAKRER